MPEPSARLPTGPEGAAAAARPPLPPAPWHPDLGTGEYQNPVLFADYSDPDVIRVGDDFWMTASSFCHVPGLPLLHSRDLVNWTLAGHALPRLVPPEHYAMVRHGDGVWAPSLRYHNGRYRIFYPDPDFGIYCVTSPDPRGPWSDPHLVMAGKGAIDPCPLWDDDGRCYLVHGWARSRSGINNQVTLRELTADGSRPIGGGRVIIDGHQLGWHTLEGPKLYRSRGWYWIFAPAGGVANGFQAVFRARQITGPYEHRVVLAQGRTSINGPHQGAWVDTPTGEHWFLHFQEQPAYGRVVHLQPMRWRDDDWPEIGRPTTPDEPGEPVLRGRKPALPLQPLTAPATSDDYAHGRLEPQWQWQANPASHWFEIRPATLVLPCLPLTGTASLWSVPHLLLQKFPAPEFTVEVVLQLDAGADGDRAGLLVFGYDYAWLGLRTRAGQPEVVFVTCRNAPTGTPETVRTIEPSASRDEGVHLRVEVHAGGRCSFGYAVGGGPFIRVGDPFQARSSRWVGAKVGLFSAGGDRPASGAAHFGPFRVGPRKFPAPRV